MCNKTVFHVAKMDCSAEEQMIRLRLNGDDHVQKLEFDIPSRQLIVYHNNSIQAVADKIGELNLNLRIVHTTLASTVEETENRHAQQKLLWKVLLINLACFLLELTTGLIAKSMGLIADSFDMLADSIVYSLALFAVSKTASFKKNIAKTSGYFQMVLATIGLVEVFRRFLGLDLPPDFETMIIISFIALIGNSIYLWLLQKSKSNESHIKASMIFTSNDVIINLGVIAAGCFVYLTGSNKPDLIIGVIVFTIVFKGALRILKLGN